MNTVKLSVKFSDLVLNEDLSVSFSFGFQGDSLSLWENAQRQERRDILAKACIEYFSYDGMSKKMDALVQRCVYDDVKISIPPNGDHIFLDTLVDVHKFDEDQGVDEIYAVFSLTLPVQFNGYFADVILVEPIRTNMVKKEFGEVM